LTSLPSASRRSRRPSRRRYSSTFSRKRELDSASERSAARSISTLKWPEFASTQPSFATARWRAPTTFLSPVAVTMKSEILAASSSGRTR